MKFRAKYLLMVLLALFVRVTSAGSQVKSDSIWTMPGYSESMKAFDISVYVSDKSQWDVASIKARLQAANLILNQCQISVRKVYFHKWTLPGEKLRVDDIEERQVYYDGMRNAGQKSLKVTPVQLFYFEDYIEPFTYGGSVPLAIVAGDGFPSYIENTAWFPYNSAQRHKPGGPTYSEDAHELGHILLRAGHDHSGDENIMANDSKKRTARFNPVTQCPNLKIPEVTSEKYRCAGAVSNLLPLFKTYFLNYARESYMNTWCARNSDNLQKAIRNLGLYPKDKIHAVYVKHKISGQSLSPKMARHSSTGWTYHTFLLIDGEVFDMDYTAQPKVEDVSVYLSNMWGEGLGDLIFQVREVDEMSGYTRVEVHASFESAKYPQYSAAELVRWSNASACTL